MIEKCNSCKTPLEEHGDYCLCNENLCKSCCECDKTCGCECDLK